MGSVSDERVGDVDSVDPSPAAALQPTTASDNAVIATKRADLAMGVRLGSDSLLGRAGLTRDGAGFEERLEPLEARIEDVDIGTRVELADIVFHPLVVLLGREPATDRVANLVERLEISLAALDHS